MPTRKPPAVVHAHPPCRPKPALPAEPPPPLHRSQATSKAFWALMDRWGVPDEKAVQLIGHISGLTLAGKRPRFMMTGDEAKRFAFLKEIDANLQTIFGEAGPMAGQEEPGIR